MPARTLASGSIVVGATWHIRDMNPFQPPAINSLNQIGFESLDLLLTVVDVRAPGEYDEFHIDGAMNIPVSDLRTRHAELDAERPLVVVCASGHRSSLASSILRQQGFGDVRNAAGGMTAYAAAGYGPECPMCAGPHGPGAAVLVRAFKR